MAGSPVRRWARAAPGVALAALISVLHVGCDGDSDGVDLGDVTPPSVLATSPMAGDEAGPDVRLTVVFDEDVDSGSAADGISLIGVAGSVAYDAPTRTAAFEPDEPLDPGAYTLSIRSVRDLAGNVMVGAVTVSFVVR
ncbi:hypothetical protein CMK11_08830 [Candidatus Poribacteria bacterium]|nr:hypothetical protein [Candidatus Poribacteria bacterium]